MIKTWSPRTARRCNAIPESFALAPLKSGPTPSGSDVALLCADVHSLCAALHFSCASLHSVDALLNS